MKPKKKGRALKVILALLVFATFFTVGTGISSYFDTGEFQPGMIFKKPADKVILVVGVDARNKNEPSRSDTAMLVFFHPLDNRIDILSVPRDSRVSIPGQIYKRKINFAHAQGGTKLLIKTLDNLLYIDIDRYIEVDFQGFKNAIDALGGVEINVERRMYYPAENIDLKPGLQTLNGYDALAYVRWRGDGRGDIGRVERQQKFLRALVRQVTGVSGLIHSPSAISEVVSNVKTDLSTAEMTAAAGQFSVDPTINTYTLPGESQMLYGASYWVLDEDEIKIMMKQITSPIAKDDLTSPE